MPRLPASLLRLASHSSPFLPPILRECRDLASSRNELRWLTEHAISQSRKRREAFPNSQSRPPRLRSRSGRTTTPYSRPFPGWRILLRGYIQRRERGEPLQYIIGSQPFGALEIRCKPGVLIPRGETEVYTSRVGGLAGEFLGDGDQALGGRLTPLRVLDLCTGTGCIPLSLYEMLSRGRRGSEGVRLKLEVLGVDIASTALDLAKDNLRHNISVGHFSNEASNEIRFLYADVLQSSPLQGQEHSQPSAPYILDALKDALGKGKQGIDILTANPPYISPTHFSSGRITRSVRKYEPRLALVSSSVADPIPPVGASLTPLSTPAAGDEFYHRILPLSRHLDAGLTVLEVGDTEQAWRVIELARRAVATESTETRQGLPVLLEMWFDDGRSEVCKNGDNVTMEGSGDRKGWAMRRGQLEAVKRDGLGEDPAEEVSARAIVIWSREWAVWRRRERLRKGEECS